MGRGGDLTHHERAFVHNRIMLSWDSELRQIKSGGRKKVIKACVKGGARACESTILTESQEKRQKEESEKRFPSAGELRRMDRGAC